MASGTHFYLNWAKERIDEMDAVLTSLESKANEVAAESRSAAEKTIAELRDKRNTFFDDMKKQAETSEGAWLQAKARLESEWESFQADARKYVEGVGQQLKQQQTTFQDVAAAQQVLGDWRLEKCTLFVTKEPCPMCAGAIVHCRPERVVFGCPDSKAGAAGGWINLLDANPPLNHRCDVTAGVLGAECLALLQGIFREAREKKKAERLLRGETEC